MKLAGSVGRAFYRNFVAETMHKHRQMVVVKLHLAPDNVGVVNHRIATLVLRTIIT